MVGTWKVPHFPSLVLPPCAFTAIGIITRSLGLMLSDVRQFKVGPCSGLSAVVVIIIARNSVGRPARLLAVFGNADLYVVGSNT